MATSCGGDPVTAGGELQPTPEPAPTLVGEVVEAPQSPVQTELIFVGVPSTEAIDIRALPGLDQPKAPEVPPGTPIEPLGRAFETDDGLVWWQVRAGITQGWIQPNVAFLGPAEDITDQVLGQIGADTRFPSADEAAAAVAATIATGEDEIVVVERVENQARLSVTVTSDLVSSGDDSVAGVRVITAVNSQDGNRPVSVVQSLLCHRGVGSNGLCL